MAATQAFEFYESDDDETLVEGQVRSFLTAEMVFLLAW